MTIKKFMIFDLIALSVMAIIADVVAYIATGGELAVFYLMFSIPIMLIAYVRWKYAGLFLNLVVILLHFILYGNDLFSDMRLLVGYTLGIMAVGLSQLWFLLIKPDRIRTNWLVVTLYYLTGYFAMFIVNLITANIITGNIQLLDYIVRHSLGFILGLVIIIIASLQKSFMIDMKSYLLNQIKEKQDEGK